MITKKQIRAVRERLERAGWTQGSYGSPEGPNCLVGAFYEVDGTIALPHAAEFCQFLEKLNCINGPQIYGKDNPACRVIHWNDDPARTKEHVLDLLRYAEQECKVP